ncbi:hypothetical protein GFS31_15760 [Leptolyngbya sp. BL0902]|nr:hypothetical protein GFS31_15760 [Leptolyngbya sp. BL0902]
MPKHSGQLARICLFVTRFDYFPSPEDSALRRMARLKLSLAPGFDFAQPSCFAWEH